MVSTATLRVFADRILQVDCNSVLRSLRSQIETDANSGVQVILISASSGNGREFPDAQAKACFSTLGLHRFKGRIDRKKMCRMGVSDLIDENKAARRDGFREYRVFPAEDEAEDLKLVAKRMS